MISYPEYKGKLIKIVEKYPIYDREDDHVVIGHTEIGDMAVVTYANKDEDYYEMIIVWGKYIGVDTLALSGKDLEKSIFIFNTTQQIRHPLNMIEQRTEQLLEDELNNDEKEKVIDIRNAQQRIAYILRGVMDVSTIDAKNIKIVKNQYKVANLLTEITLRSKQEATEKGLEFRTNFDEAIPEMLYGDSIRLKQIINALISNAIKYTKEGFVELNVNSIVSFDVCRLVVSVKDSGIGVNAEDINKLFQSKTDKNDISDKVMNQM